MLLPKNEEAEDEEDPRDDLARRLAEYQSYKEASGELRKTEFSSRYMFFKEEEKIEFPLPEYDRKHTIDELTSAFNSIMQRKLRFAKPEKRAFSGIVGRQKVSVEEMTERLSGLMKATGRLNLKKAFSGTKSKPEMVATFLAVLEMIRSNRIIAEYDEEAKDFILIKTKKEVNDEQR